MKIFNKLKRSVRKSIILGAIAATVLGGTALVANHRAYASGADCDSNAVINCGGSVSSIISKYDRGDGRNSASSIQHIYSYFGISSAQVHAMTTTSREGYVTKSGDVYVGGQLVATNALTAGRSFMPGSNRVTYLGTTFYTRTPSVSFRSGQLSAAVVMKDGVFQYAILHACGNPVKATPKKPKVPNYELTKEVREKSKPDYHKSITVDPATPVVYRITVRSTGSAAAKNIVVKDVLPNHVQYVDNSLKQDNVAVSGDDQFFAGGITISSLDPGKSVVFTFEAVVGPNETPVACTTEKLTNTGTIKSPDLPGKNDTADVQKECKPQPVYTCDSLTPQKISRDTYSFTAQASASNGARITGYLFNFGDNQSTTTSTATTNHSYAQPGNYTITVTAQVDANGVPKTVTSSKCITSVTVVPPQVAECTGLDLKLGENRSVVATASFTPGAILTGASFDFGDATPLVTTTTNSASHTYAKDDNYLVVATLTFTVESKTVTTHCQASVSVNTPQPTYSCDLLTVSFGVNRTVTVTNFKTSATNGAVFSKADISWGTAGAVTTTDEVIGQTHQYAAPGTYTITAAAHFTVNGEDKTAAPSTSCVQTVTIPAENCTVPGKENLPKDSPQCGEEKCTVPGKENLPKNSPQCEEKCTKPGKENLPKNSPDCKEVTLISTTTPTPTTLVNTGAGSVIGIFFATSLAGAAFYRFALVRRFMS